MVAKAGVERLREGRGRAERRRVVGVNARRKGVELGELGREALHDAGWCTKLVEVLSCDAQWHECECED